jgi:hypothetical protein
MMNRVHSAYRTVEPLLTVVALLLVVGWTTSGCEALDNLNSAAVCGDYCSKKFDCESHSPTSSETSDCVGACRNSIEDNCGNEHQAAANDKIAECVDQSCAGFWGCMVFEASPECFGFVSH